MPQLLFFCKAPMNALMFARPLAQLWSNSDYNLAFTGQGRSHGSASAIMAQAGFKGVREASQFGVRWRAWDAYISPDLYMPARRARHRIQIFHGISFKGKMYTPAIQRFNQLFLIGADMRRRLIERGLFPSDYPGLHEVGMPKLDAFFDGSLSREATLRELGIDPCRPVVLYAPTWRPESSIYSHGLKFIEHCRTEERWTLVVKLHDWMWDKATNPIDWNALIPELETPHVRFARSANVVPLLHAADLLVSDASSVANEYLLLNRPLVWLDAPALLQKYADTMDLSAWGRSTGPIADGLESLLELVAAQLTNPGEYAKTRQAAAADLFYNPGSATQAFLTHLEHLLLPAVL